MPILKAIVGHGASVRSTIAYLTRDGRAVASDFLHCAEVDARGDPVWRQMDDARRLIGTDVPVGGRPVRTWQHFVVSPDPDDHVDLRTLRDLTRTWVRRYFGDFQAAIYYHDDNALDIPHAHVIVNNPNLATGGRVSTALRRHDLREAYLGLQDMAEERGLARLPDWWQGRGSKGSVQPTYRSHDDVEIEERGISWKKDVRDRMACAMRLSETEADYVGACRALGLTVRVSMARRLRGEYVYGHPASDGREVAGSTLGSSWSRDGVRRRIADDLVRGVVKPRGEARERLLEAIGSLETADGTLALQVMGTTHGLDVTAEMVSSMVDACAEWDVASLADFDEALSEAKRPEDVRLLTEARELAATLGWLPEERDVGVDGWRAGHGTVAGEVGDAFDDWWKAPGYEAGLDARDYGLGGREAERAAELGWLDDMGEW